MRISTNKNKEYPPKVLRFRNPTCSLNMAYKMLNAPNNIIVYDDKTLVNHSKQSKLKN